MTTPETRDTSKDADSLDRKVTIVHDFKTGKWPLPGHRKDEPLYTDSYKKAGYFADKFASLIS